IVEWSGDAATFVARALSPAKVSSVTVGEAEAEGSQPSVLVLVPDSQLSLAIGKRGQNARLAAKLTGLRVDIKSESEVEEERHREETERTEGRAALSMLPGASPSLVERLVEAGLFSPARVVKAGVAALAEVPGVGEGKAASLFQAAEAWGARPAPPAAAAAEAEVAEGLEGDVGSAEATVESAEATVEDEPHDAPSAPTA